MSGATESRGGAIATRGLLVQTLVALLDITKSEHRFTEITLEPKVGDDQFDFLWKDDSGSHATQVKSTERIFARPDVEKWAKKLQKARTNEACTLFLIGNIHHSLAKLDPVGKVILRQKPLDLDGLIAEAAQRLAEFMESEDLDAGKATERIKVVHALESKLQHLSADATTLKRDAFISQLREWIATAPKAGIPVDISRIVKYAPVDLIGREDETKLIEDAWSQANRGVKKRPHIFTFVALGGEGKTSLVAKWAANLAAQDWPGCDAVFAWSFYSQGTRETVAPDSDLFLKAALTFFGDEEDKLFAASAAGAHEKATRLARIVGQRRCLLILDGLEPLQYPPSSTAFPPGELKDKGIAKLLSDLAAASHGLCIVTTRFALPDLRAFFGKTVREEKLTRLGRAAGVQLLKAHGVTGSDRRNLPLKDSDEHSEKLSEFEKLVEDVDGHALTLHIMGSFLKRAFQGDIRRRDRVTFAKASEKTDNGHAFRAMAAYEKWMADGSEEARRELALLSLMGLFDRPATADCLQALLQAPTIAGLTEPLVGLSEEDWNGSLTALQDASLLTVNSDAAGTLLSLDAHPLLREYFAVRLRIHAGHQAPTGRNIPAQGNALSSGIKNSGSPEGATHGADVSPLQGLRDSGAAVPGALPQAGMSRPVGAGTQLGTSEAWREAHRRLYEHLCAMTPHFPDGLEGLQPLYQAIHHGCSAGEYESACTDVLRARVRRGEKIQYSWRVLGAYASDLSAIRCFFEGDWSRLHTAISSETACWLYNAAGVRLRALGQLLDAFSPMRHGAELTVELLGKAGQPEYVSYRDDAAMRWTNLAELSIGLGKLCEAQRFAEIALSLFNETDRSYRKIPALAFQAHACICGGEFEKGMGLFRAAEELQRKSDRPTDGLFAVIGIHRINSLLISVERVAWRSIAIQTNLTGSIVIAQEIESRIAFGLLKASENSQILHCALYSERRAYCELLKSLGNNRPVSAHVVSIVEAAVRKLITAGHREHIPRGLLTRAWQRSLTGARTGPESAQSDLDEAWEIAERGPMPLFMADIHLHRARLFFREEVYPWREAKNRKGELATNRTAKDDLEDAAKLIAECGYHRRDEELADAQRAILS